MINENELKEIVEKVIEELEKEEKKENNSNIIENNENSKNNDQLIDITDVDLKKQFLVDNPENKEAFLKLKENTSARLGVGRAGPRYKTETLLRFRADHAAAMDAVFTDVSDELIKEMNLFKVKTLCRDKDEYLKRPDLGKKFSDETLAEIHDKCDLNPQVQIYAADGLSSTAIEANLKDIFPAIKQGLEGYNITIGTPFFVQYGRVASMEPISKCLDADVCCVLIGERPGLATAESLSCYMAYKAEIGMPESRRNVISNIHADGTPAVEAGAHIADVIKAMLEQKTSGLDLEI
ncbi:MAG: ethanolamine ammonia-lyase subunit EutC [Halanaerobium sp.]